MRRCLLTLALFLAATGVHAADAVRIPLIGGLYTAEAPGGWHLEESGADLTATFSETADAAAALVIAAPNPAAPDAAAHNRLAAGALLAAFGNGEITHEQEEIRGGARAHALWFAFEVSGAPFTGWSKTVRCKDAGDAGVLVQAMAIAPADQFDAFMRTAAPIFDSCELDEAMVKENTDLLTEVGEKIIGSFAK